MRRRLPQRPRATRPPASRVLSSGWRWRRHRSHLLAAGLPPNKCPKCGHRQDDPFACHKCGLVFANAQKRRPWDEIPPNRKVAYGRVESAFRRLVAGESDAAAHAAFEAVAVKEQAVEYAIRLYRHHLADYPGDETSAAALSGLVQRAQMVAQSLAREQIKTTVGAASRSLKWGLRPSS